MMMNNNNPMMMNNNNPMMMNNNNQMMMNNSNNQILMNNSNNQMMMNNSNNQMMMNNNNNQINNNKMKELLEELDYMRNKVNLYEKRIKTLEDRIKEKDSEIVDLKNKLSSIYDNYDNYKIMKEINIKPKKLTLNFTINNDVTIGVQCRSDKKIESAITNFKIKLCNDDIFNKLSFFYKGEELNKNLLIEEYGISDKDTIDAVDKNDENQMKRLNIIPSLIPRASELEMFSPNISITFNANTGIKTILLFREDTKLSDAIKLYCKKFSIEENEIGKDIMFLYYGQQLDYNSNQRIKDIFRNNSIITVYNLREIISA